MVLVCPTLAYAADLFIEVPEHRLANMQGDQQALMDKLWQKRTTKSLRVIRIDLALLQQDAVDLNLRADRAVRVETQRIERRNVTDYTWYGRLTAVPGSAILVVQGENVTGTIRNGEELYRITSLGAGLHTLIEVDESQPHQYALVPDGHA